jgi:hypothetical protein
MHIYGNAKYLGYVWLFVSFFFEFLWNVCFVDKLFMVLLISEVRSFACH